MSDFETIALRLRDELIKQLKHVLSLRLLFRLLRSSWRRLCSIGVSPTNALSVDYGSGHPLPDSIHLLLVSESDHEPVHPAMRECKSQSPSCRQVTPLVDSTV
eukprot:scaffold2431_cov130-Amphora_coffeaeformis.AAC.3